MFYLMFLKLIKLIKKILTYQNFLAQFRFILLKFCKLLFIILIIVTN